MGQLSFNCLSLSVALPRVALKSSESKWKKKHLLFAGHLKTDYDINKIACDNYNTESHSSHMKVDRIFDDKYKFMANIVEIVQSPETLANEIAKSWYQLAHLKGLLAKPIFIYGNK